MNERVFIRHPDHPDRNGHVTRTAFDALWSKKGYVIEGDELAEPVDDMPAAEATPDQINAQLDEKARLRAVLEAAGVEVDGRWGLKRLQVEAETARDMGEPSDG